MERIYLDHNSTTPVLPAVVEAMRPYWESSWANPASVHAAGRTARRALEEAREKVAALLHAHPDEVIFTSGGTEANNLALFGLTDTSPTRILSSAIEHPSVAEPLAQLAGRGSHLELLKVSSEGISFLHSVSASEAPFDLVTMMLVNNETGAIQPVKELAARMAGVPLHCDAVQAVGRMPVDFAGLGVASLSLSAHKLNGPKGIGALLLRKGARLRNLHWGGHQQQGRRPGTEPVALAVGLARALEIACCEMANRSATVLQLRSAFLSALNRSGVAFVFNGPVSNGLPHALNLSFPGCPADALLIRLDMAGVCCSTGAACSSGSLLPSPVLKAMGCPPDVLNSAIRFSLSHLNTNEEIAKAARRVAETVGQIRSLNTSSP